MLFVIFSIFSVVYAAQQEKVTVDFDAWTEGDEYTETMAGQDFGNTWMFAKSDRMTIGRDEKSSELKHLKVEYPAGEYGVKNSGGLFVVRLEPSDQCYLEYKMKFDPDFDFSNGGFLPGMCGDPQCFRLYGQGSETRRSSSGRSRKYDNDDRGDAQGLFSVQPVWTKNGQLFVRLNPSNKTFTRANNLETNYHIPKGRWITIKQRVTFEVVRTETDPKDDPDSEDEPRVQNAKARVEFWVNSVKRLDKLNATLTVGHYKIGAFVFVTYFNGSGPNKDTYADFSDFIIKCS